jgi:hypothetical protein
MAIEKQINIVVKETGLDNVQKNVNALDASLGNLDDAFKEAEDATVSFRTQLREANQELLKASQKFGETSVEAVTAAKKVANLKDQMGFAKDLVDKFNPDQKFKALGAATQLATTANSGLVSGIALLGDESESTQKALLQVQSAMAFSESISSLSNLGDQWRVLKTTIMANSVVTKIATTVQKLWNLAMAANPIGALVAVILLAIGAIASLTSYLISSSKANKEAMNATEANSKALKRQSIESQKSSDALKSNNDYQYESAKAAGASSEQLRKLTIKHNEETIALNLKNAKLAQATFLRERDTLATLQANDASDEAIKKQKELTDSTYKEFQEQNKILSDSYKERHNIEKKNSIEVIGEKKSAQDKINEDAKTAKQKEQDRLKEEKQKEKDLVKSKLDADMQSAKDAAAILDELKKAKETPAQKLQREFEEKKAVLEANNLSTEELEVQHIDAMFAISEEDRKKKEESEKLASDKSIEIANEEKRQKQVIAEANMGIATKTVDLLSQLAGKNKALQKAGIIASAGIGIYSVIKDTQAANMAAIAPPPLGLGPIAGIGLQTKNTIQGALSTASIIAASAKALASVGGGSVSGSSTGGGGSTSAPSFNLVQGTASNQIATSISKQQPIQAFVVSKDVTSGQELDRNIVKGASL